MVVPHYKSPISDTVSYNHINDKGQKSHLLVATSGWTWLPSYLPLGQGVPERVGGSTEDAFSMRGSTLQIPGPLAVTRECQA